MMAADMSRRLGWIDDALVQRIQALNEQAKLPVAPPPVCYERAEPGRTSSWVVQQPPVHEVSTVMWPQRLCRLDGRCHYAGLVPAMPLEAALAYAVLRAGRLSISAA